MPTARNALVRAAPVVGIMLIALGLLALLSRVVPVDLESFVLAALLPVVAARLPHAHGLADRVRDGAVIGVAALVAVELPALIARLPLLGIAGLIACAVASKALRGRSRSLGIAAAGAGLTVRLALISLVSPGRGSTAIGALLAVGLVALVFLCRAGWERLHFDHHAQTHAATKAGASHAARRTQRRSGTLQMLLAFSAACLLGRWLFGEH